MGEILNLVSKSRGLHLRRRLMLVAQHKDVGHLHIGWAQIGILVHLCNQGLQSGRGQAQQGGHGKDGGRCELDEGNRLHGTWALARRSGLCR